MFNKNVQDNGLEEIIEKARHFCRAFLLLDNLMLKKISIFFAALLIGVNVICWQEVFVLAKPNFLEVYFLDVGQGDSTFIETPENHQILIDGGPDDSIISKLPALMPPWDKEIDLVILSHPEKDHMQGLLSLLKTYKADYILWSGVKRDTPEGKAWEDIKNRQINLGAKILIADPNLKIKAGNVLIDTLYPQENMEGVELKNTSNDACVVTKIVYKDRSFLFTGDISTSVENKIINSKEDVSADVLKIAHHGSKYSTSSAFLSAVSPIVATISVGAKNTYGHPTQEVLQKLLNFGIKVLRTDTNSDIEIVSDGIGINIK